MAIDNHYVEEENIIDIFDKEMKESPSTSHSIIYGWIAQHQTIEALHSLKHSLQTNRLVQYKNNYEQISTVYHTMLKYMADGIKDPEQEKLQRKLIKQVLELNDLQACSILKDNSRNYFFVRKRYLNESFQRKSGKEFESFFADTFAALESHKEQILLMEQTESLDDFQKNALISLYKQYEDELALLFEAIWLTVHSKEADEYYQLILTNSFMSDSDKAMLISAFTLSLTTYFEERKALVLFKAAQNENAEIRIRALTGIILMLVRHDEILCQFPTIIDAYKSIIENESLRSEILDILIEFYRALDTNEINRKMMEDILPTMSKLANESKYKPNQNTDEMGLNPEWQESMDKSGLTDKLMEINQLQSEGADVFFSTFLGLKSFSFFNSIANWFMPFNKDHSSIKQVFRNSSGKSETTILSMVSASVSLCDSDKYSFCISLEQMPESQREVLAQQFAGNTDEMIQDELKESLIKESKKPKLIAKQYIQDLYRFYKLHPQHASFMDPFAQSFLGYDNEYLEQVIFIPENLDFLSNYFLNKKHFTPAYELFSHKLIMQGPSAELYQKLAFCKAKIADREKALDLYKKADLLDSQNIWTMRRIIDLLKADEEWNPENVDHHQLLHYCDRILEIEPEHVPTLLDKANCLNKTNKSEEALNIYFKVNYLKPDNLTAKRGIAWSYLLMNKIDQAKKYAGMLIEEGKNYNDFVNLAHCYLAEGDIKNAMKYYLEANNVANKQNSDQFEFYEIINDDREILERLNIPVNLINTLGDLFNYKYFENDPFDNNGDNWNDDHLE
ncbi:MAG: tetratricopeptide repeat protein [Bacteroidales bacterium]